ncbi:MAG TPA: hypothetical protein VK892_23800 [Pyrinomonadaceae bacterium]|nr:hypothetical protein [Pyrinomonadaceae bacterium]
MNRFKKFTALFAFALMILGLPVIASAQWRDNRRNDDDYYRNSSVNTRALKSTIKNLNNRSKQFEKRVDRELDRSRYNNRRGEDRLNDMANRFADAARDLDRRFDSKRDLRDSASEARRVLELGSQLDRALSRANFSYNIQNEWNRIRQDLSQIANAYRYNDHNRRGNDRRNDDWRSNFPFPF